MNDLTLFILPEEIKTERLFLRPYRAGDGKLLLAVGQRNREHLSRFEADNFLLSLADENDAEVMSQELQADWQARKHLFLGIFEQGTGEWVGQVYVGAFCLDVPVFSIGYVADVDHEGKGYITEAVKAVLQMLFIDLRAHRVQADCHEANERSWRLLERCGFRREGHLRDNKVNSDGSYHGDYLYGLLRNEFLG